MRLRRQLLGRSDLSDVAVDLASRLRHRLDRTGVERLCDDVLDSEPGRRGSKVEEERHPFGGQFSFETSKASVRAGPNHDALFVIANGGDRDTRITESRQQKIVLRVGRVLKLVDEHEGIGGVQGARDLGSSP